MRVDLETAFRGERPGGDAVSHAHRRRVKVDTRKLDFTEAFRNSIMGDATADGRPGGRQAASLKSFAEKRRACLLNHAEVKTAAK